MNAPVSQPQQLPLQTLRSRQIAGLKQLINLNQTVSGSIAVEPVWKVLVFDRFGQDIISPLLSVKELRDLGVTLHLLLDSMREALPDVPCVYFILPTEDNVRIVCQDFSSSMYESYYLNFISALSRPRLEELATAAVQHQCLGQVQKVYDQYLNFISLEDDLFTLRRHNESSPLSFYAMNRGDMSEETMSSLIDEIVDGLFSVCVTLGVVPIIRCPRNNAAEQVAQSETLRSVRRVIYFSIAAYKSIVPCFVLPDQKLDKKLRDNLRDARNNLFTQENVRAGQFNFQRPVLIIVDRGMDLATMLHHTWTYQALVHDVLELELNRVVISDTPSTPGSEPPKRGKVKEYDLNVTDKFWMAHKGSPFPQVAEAVQEELESYRSSEEEIKRIKHAMGLDGGESDEAISMISDATAKLTTTVSSLPELLERKRLIDLHTNVATAVLDHIKARKLDQLFETEEKLLNRQLPETPLIDTLGDPACGSTEDKLRLFLLNYICSDNISDSELKQQMGILEAAGADDAAVKFVKRWKSFTKMVSRDEHLGAGTKTVSMFSKLLNHSSQLVMEGVKNLVPKRHNLPVTKVVDAIMEVKTGAETDEYRYFDPKLMRANESAVPRTRAPANDAIVFVIGGGNYVEYQNLMDYRKHKSAGPVPKRITYGTTELVTASQFIAQLTRLGRQV